MNKLSQLFDQSQRGINRPPLDNPRLLSGDYWGELRVFLAVAKAKSFNRAAEELKSSQPKVSREVRRLQDILGVQLLISSKSGILLTLKGEELAQWLAEQDKRLSSFFHDLRGATRDAEGVVRVFAKQKIKVGKIIFSDIPFSKENGMLRPNLKIDRKKIAAKYSQVTPNTTASLLPPARQLEPTRHANMLFSSWLSF